jgi:hypothetical protein
VQKNKDGTGIWQATVTLPHFHCEVPVLYLADGAPYIPVRALCAMLGLRAERHIPKWRKLMFWGSARKLPFLGSTKGARVIWCIPMEQYPFIFGCFDWQLVSSERRTQLRQAADAWSEASGQAYLKMRAHYKYVRHLLFTFFTMFANADTLLRRYEDLSCQSLDFEAVAQLDALVHRGKGLLFLTSTHARKMLQDQEDVPIVDAARMKDDSVEPVFLPLIPVVSREDGEQFIQHLENLTAYLLNLTDFLDEHGISYNEK